MTDYTHQTASTRFVEANGFRFTYRPFGKAGGLPLIFNQHFRGTIDYWGSDRNGWLGDEPNPTSWPAMRGWVAS